MTATQEMAPAEFARRMEVTRFAERLKQLKQEPLGFTDAMSEIAANPERLIPFVGAVDESAELAELYAAARAIESDSASPEQEESVRAFLERGNRPRSAGYTFGSILAQLVPFAGEFAASGGVVAGAKTAGRKALARALRDAVENAGERAAKRSLVVRAAQGTVEAGAQLGVSEAISQAIGGGGRIEAATYQRALQRGGLRVSEDEAGQWKVVAEGTVPDFLDALPAGVTDMLIEFASERTGGALLRGAQQLPLVGKVAAAQSKVAEWWMRKNAGSTLGDFTRAVARRGGWHGPVSEYLEEIAGSAARAAAPNLPEGVEDIFPGFEESAAMLAAFSVPGVTIAAADVLEGRSTDEAQTRHSRGNDVGNEEVDAEAPLQADDQAPPSASFPGLGRSGAEASNQTTEGGAATEETTSGAELSSTPTGSEAAASTVPDVQEQVGPSSESQVPELEDDGPARAGSSEGPALSNVDADFVRSPRTLERRAFLGDTPEAAVLEEFEGLPDGEASDGPTIEITPEGMLDYLGRKFRDRALPIRRVQEQAVAQGGVVTEETDAYALEQLFPGKVAAQIEDFERAHVAPLMESVGKLDGGLGRFDDYVTARHVPSRNELIAKRQEEAGGPVMTAGSGMETAEANRIVAEIESGPQGEQFKQAAAQLDAIIAKTLDVMEEGGLITSEARARYESMWDHYVSMRGFAEGVNEERPRTGRGFSVRGQESKRAKGRSSRAFSPTTLAIQDFTEKVIRAEKAKVGRAFLGFARANPAPNAWRELAPDAPIPRGAQAVGFKEGGTETRLAIFDPALAQALQKIQPSSGPLLAKVGAVNRFLSRMITQWNPEFILSNFFRDVQTAGINLAGESSISVAARVMARVPSALRAAYGGLRRTDADGTMRRHFEEFRSEGAMASWVQVDAVEEAKAELEKLAQEAGSGHRGALGLFRGVGDFIGNMNGAVENSVRLAAYSVARDMGASPQKAALLAKNLTVNFNRTGELGPAANTLYLFYNASLQGTWRMFQALKHKDVRRIVYGLVLFAAWLDAMNREAGGEDDDGERFYDKIPEWEKSRNLIVMSWDGSGDYFKIPLPYGYNVFHVLGQVASEATRGELSATEATGRVVTAALDAFNPVGGGTDIAQIVSPTITDPWVQIETNRNFAGNPVRPEHRGYGLEPPDSQKFFGSVNPTIRAVTDWLNEISGGDTVQSGAIDVSPESVEVVVDFIAGGVGRFGEDLVGTVQRALAGEPHPAKEVPILRRFFGEQSEHFVPGKFYENLEDIERAKERVEVAAEQGDAARARELRRELAPLLSLGNAARSAQKRVRALRKKESAARTEAARKALAAQIDAAQRRFNKLVKRTLGGQAPDAPREAAPQNLTQR